MSTFLQESAIPELNYASGVFHISDLNLINSIIGSKNGDEKAQTLLTKFVTLDKIRAATHIQLREFLTKNQILKLNAAFELSRRAELVKSDVPRQIHSSKEGYHLLSPLMAHLQHEECWAIFLNRANRLIEVVQISKGGRAGTVVDAKILFTEALKHNASSIILAHNHPSGSLRPSQADRELTRAVTAAGKNLALPVLDHIIISEIGYYSFADEGEMS